MSKTKTQSNQTNHMKRFLLISASTLLATAWSVPMASAQDADSDDAAEAELTMDSVTITSTKRESDLNDTALAVSAYTGETKDRFGIDTLQDLADLTPGLTIQDSPNRASIRGIGRLTNALGTEPGVGVYIDGFYDSETGAAAGSSLFVDRIEVLRGPQGTLYGRNTIGGAINVISKRPTDEWEYHARASYGNFNAYTVGGYISGPITDNFRIRAAIQQETRDGYIENIGIGGDQGDVDVLTGELQFEWDITDRLSTWVRYQTGETNNTPSGAVLISDYPTDIFRGNLLVNPWFGYTEENPSASDPYKVRLNTTGFTDIDDQYQLTAHVEYDFDNVLLKYVGGYSQFSFSSQTDEDATDRIDTIDFDSPSFGTAGAIAPLGLTVSRPLSFITEVEEIKEWQSHDLQLISTNDGPFSWIAGLYYYEEDIQQPFRQTNPGNTALQNPVFPADATFTRFIPSPLPNPDSIGYFQTGELMTESYAVYGDFSYELSDKLTLSAGLRYSKDEKDALEQQRVIFDFLDFMFDQDAFDAELAASGDAIAALGAAASEISLEIQPGGIAEDTHTGSWDNVSGRVALEYRPDEDTLMYGSLSTGYKAGGFRLGGISDNPATPENEAEVDNETVTAYEAGYKSQITDGFNLNAAAYYYDYSNLQTEVTVIAFGVVNSQLFNAEEAQSYGLELEGVLDLGENTQLISSYSYNKTEIEDYCGDVGLTANTDGSTGCLINQLLPTGSNIANPSGSSLYKSPEHKFAAILAHNIPFQAGDLSIAGTYSYVGDQEYDIFNNPETSVGSYDRFDLQATWYDADGRFQVNAFVKNAFDEEAVNNASAIFFPTADDPQASLLQFRGFGAPRTYGVELQVNF